MTNSARCSTNHRQFLQPRNMIVSVWSADAPTLMMPCTGSELIEHVSLASVVVKTLDLQSRGREFDSRPPHCRVVTLDKSFTRAQRSKVTTLWRYRNLSEFKILNLNVHLSSLLRQLGTSFTPKVIMTLITLWHKITTLLLLCGVQLAYIIHSVHCFFFQ